MVTTRKAGCGCAAKKKAPVKILGLFGKTREQRRTWKTITRGTVEKVEKKTKILNFVEVLLANACVKNGVCRHNHDVNVSTTGKIMIDGKPKGYIDRSFRDAATFLIEHGYYLQNVRNSPVIYSSDGDATNITVGDVERYKKRLE